MFIVFLLALSLTLTFISKSYIGYGLGALTIWAAYTLIQRRPSLDLIQRFCASREVISIGVFVVILFVTSLLSIDVSASLEKSISISAIMLCGIIIFCGLNHSIELNDLLKVVSIIAALIGGYISFGCLTGLVAFEWNHYFGAVLVFLLPMAFSPFLQSDSFFKQAFWLICIFLIAAGVVASGSRTGWIALLVIIPFASFFFIILKRRFLLKFLLITLTFSGATLLGLLAYKNNVGGQVFDMRVQAMTNTERPASGRLEAWSEIIPYISNNLISGIGLDTTDKLEISYGVEGGASVIHAHNVILELLLELGFVGFVGFLSIIAFIVWGILQALRQSSNVSMNVQALSLLLAFVVYGVCSLAHTSIFNTWWFLYLVTFFILLKISELRLRA